MLSDFSPGMLEAARASLASVPTRFRFMEADIQTMPWGAASFDGVIANHVLFHAPDLGGAISGIRSVLQPGGQLYASTNGRAHMLELTELLDRFGITGATLQPNTRDFLLENGTETLEREFSEVSLRRYGDSLAVREVGPLVEYVRSMVDPAVLADRGEPCAAPGSGGFLQLPLPAG